MKFVRALILVLFANVTFASQTVIHMVGLPSPSAVAMTVTGLSHIRWLKDAGRYSFAIDTSSPVKAAFFDSTQWQPAQSIANFSAISEYNFVPAYPETGKTGEAWALSDDWQLSHFDMKQWSKPVSAGQILGVLDPSKWTFNIRASGGYVFLQGYSVLLPNNPDYRVAVYNPNTQRWSTPIDLKNYYGIGYSQSDLVAFNDVNPHLQAIVYSQPGNAESNTLLTVYKDGTYHLEPYHMGSANSLYNIAMQYGHDYLSVSTTTVASLLKYNSSDSLNVWKKITAPILFPDKGAYDFWLRSTNLSSHSICIIQSDQPMQGQSSVKFTCTSINDIQPQWAPEVTVPNGGDSYNLITGSDHAWVVNNWSTDGGAYLPVIYDYDIKNRTLTDTNFIKEARPSLSGDLAEHALSSSQLIACEAGDIYLYDRNAQVHWKKLDAPKTTCDFSYFYGGFVQQTAGDFWIYSQYMPPKNAVIKSKHTNGRELTFGLRGYRSLHQHHL